MKVANSNGLVKSAWPVQIGGSSTVMTGPSPSPRLVTSLSSLSLAGEGSRSLLGGDRALHLRISVRGLRKMDRWAGRLRPSGRTSPASRAVEALGLTQEMLIAKTRRTGALVDPSASAAPRSGCRHLDARAGAAHAPGTGSSLDPARPLASRSS
jgi:hypothetical protein